MSILTSLHTPIIEKGINALIRSGLQFLLLNLMNEGGFKFITITILVIASVSRSSSLCYIVF